ncbi:Pepco domain-containing protein [Plantactinospora sp. WMMB782]|uniref:Pepco domain-containing protein n=1 Tax=Plantactinospora sp. WMMB782 TaxID=3404121 RepID=UPI003B94A6AD
MSGSLADGSFIAIVYTDDRFDGEKGLFSAAKSAATKIGTVNADQLATNLEAICGRLAGVFQAARRATGGFELDSFEVMLEFTAKGEVRLIGSASTEIKGGVKVVFRPSGVELS